MKKTEIEELCRTLVTPIIEENGLILWDCEYVKEGPDYYLRVYADKEGGILIDDCVTVSRALEQKLDETGKLNDPYILEVSSPGLTRPLKKEIDFKMSIGRAVEVKLYRAGEYGKEFEATLTGYTPETVSLELPDKQEITLPRDQIAGIRLAFRE